jgi:gas vesicle protein
MSRNNGSIHHDEAYSAHRDRGDASKVVPFMIGAIIGGVVGATLALLYAPAEGSDLRKGVSETLDDLTQGAKDMIRTAKSTADKFIREIIDDEVEDEEEPSHGKRTRARADDIIEDADRAIAEARQRASDPSRYDEDED